MKHIFYQCFFLSILVLSSCSTQKEDDHIVKYGNKEVTSANFINKLMVLGFIKHGPTFYTKIYDADFFDSTRSDTLEHIVSSMFYKSLSQKYEIKITDAELENWIKSRTPDLNQEDLVYTLKANNLSVANWRSLFREQLIQDKVIQTLSEIKESADPNKKIKKSSDDALFLAIITFEDAVKAKETYQRIARNKINYDDVLKQENNTSTYSWIKTKELPFYKKIQYLSNKRVSKPLETSWGHLLIRIAKRGKYPLIPKDTASRHLPASIKPLLEDFKKDPKLQINTDLLYSLKIKK